MFTYFRNILNRRGGNLSYVSSTEKYINIRQHKTGGQLASLYKMYVKEWQLLENKKSTVANNKFDIFSFYEQRGRRKLWVSSH